MKPVDQRFLVAEHGHGDCARACVASLLELPADAVPDFSLFGWRWLDALVLFAQVELVVPDEADGYWMAMGVSPRGVRHSVVYLDHALAHDPHPSRAGLVGNVDGGMKILRLRQNARERREQIVAAAPPAASKREEPPAPPTPASEEEKP